MNTIKERIEEHYHKEGLLEEILLRLQKMEVDLNSVSRKDIAPVDEFHVRGAEVSRELARSIELKACKVLDVGCGLGGPARMLADDFNCQVTGIDLSREFIRTAQELSKRVGLGAQTEFIVADACHLPFEDGSFDMAWTQHVQMNIPDKFQFYSEIYKVLKPGGYFLYYDIFSNKSGKIAYPMPWASTADQSFLIGTPEFADLMDRLGFRKISTTDQTKSGIRFFEDLMHKIKTHGPPPMGLNVLMGESTQPKLTNLLNHLKHDLLALQSGVYQKTS